jgi:hypothetical protein
MLATIVAIAFTVLQYAVASAIGLPAAVAAIVAVQTGVIVGMLGWLRGAPSTGSGVGRRWI